MGSKRIRTGVGSFFLLLLFLLWHSVSHVAYASENLEKLSGYNIVLLIDKSGSMNGTDRDRLAVDAAKMFVDSLYVENLQYDDTGDADTFTGSFRPDENGSESSPNFRVGVVSFAQDTEIMTAPIDIVTLADLETVTGSIDQIRYLPSGSGSTDIGRAVLTATDMLKDLNDAGKENIIVLFSDGYTDGSLVNLELSENMLNEAKETARDISCEIYTIGLNYQGSIKEDGKRKMWEIANDTQLRTGIALPDAEDSAANGRVNYLITDSLQEIQSFYIALFAQLMNGDVPNTSQKSFVDGWSYYDLPIDSEDISWVKAYILSDGPIGAYVVRSPDGEMMNENPIVHARRGSGYVLLTIDKPQMGMWNICAEGDVTYSVRYLTMSQASLDMEVIQGEGSAGVVTVTGRHSQEPFDESFYEGIQSLCYMEAEDGNLDILEIPLAYDESSRSMTGTFQFPVPGNYHIFVELRTQGGQVLHAEKEVSALLSGGSPLTLSMSKGETKTIDIEKDYIAGWEGMSLVIDQVESDPDNVVDSSFDGGQLTLHALMESSAALRISCHDNLGNAYLVNAEVEVKEKKFPIAFVVLACMVLAGVLSALYISSQKQYIPGYFEINCFTESESVHDLSIEPPHGRSFSLYRLVRMVLKNASDYGSSAAAVLLSLVEKNKKILKSQDYSIHIYKPRQHPGHAPGEDKRQYRYGRDNGLLNGDTIFHSDEADGQELNISVEFRRQR